MDILSIRDFIASIVILTILWLYTSFLTRKGMEYHIEYKYLGAGLFVRIIGGFMFCMLYIFYYQGGDTLAYYESGVALGNMMTHNFGVYLSITLGDLSMENFSEFTQETGWPASYMYRDPKTFSVVRYMAPLLVISGNSYLGATYLLTALAYSGTWKLYRLFCHLYKGLETYFAFSILFVPSLVFWATGILKDTFTFSALCWFVVSFHSIFVAKKHWGRNLITLTIAFSVIISIKPYIVMVMLPGCVFWGYHSFIQKIRSWFIRLLLIPLTSLIVLAGTAFVLFAFDSSFGKFSMGNSLEYAVEMKEDLSREDSYGENYHDIGYFDGTLSGILKIAPKAIIAGFFRPFLWEVRNLVMLFSGLENFILLLLTIIAIIKCGIFKFFKMIVANPFLMFCFSFTFFFAFMVGFTTPNFGALVRYKIPLLPFYICMILILIDTAAKDKQGKGHAMSSSVF